MLNITWMKYILTIFLIWERFCHIDGQDGLICLSCSYNRSTNPLVGYYECILNPFAESIMACPPTFQCKTIAIFDAARTYIMSATRNCLPIANPGCPGDNCCNIAGLYPMCEQKCSESLCNNYDPENWLTISYEEGNTQLPRIGWTRKTITTTTTAKPDDVDSENNDESSDNDDDTSGDVSTVKGPTVMVSVKRDLFEIDSVKSCSTNYFNGNPHCRHILILISIIVLNLLYH